MFRPCGIQTAFSSTAPETANVQTGIVPSSRKPASERYPSGVDRAVGVLVRPELDEPAASIADLDRLVDLRDQHGAADGRGERGDEQAVVAAGVGAGHGPGRVAADPVRDEPLAAERRVEKREERSPGGSASRAARPPGPAASR